jgi:hypothetical protein
VGRRVSTRWSPVVVSTEPSEVCVTLNPGPDVRCVGDAREVFLQGVQVDSLLQGELNIGVVKFQAGLLSCGGRRARVALGVSAVGEADALPDEASSRGPVLAVVVVEVHVVRIALSRRMRREVDDVVMRLGLLVGVNEPPGGAVATEEPAEPVQQNVPPG